MGIEEDSGGELQEFSKNPRQTREGLSVRFPEKMRPVGGENKPLEIAAESLEDDLGDDGRVLALSGWR
jgi:hypothetical protein